MQSKNSNIRNRLRLGWLLAAIAICHTYGAAKAQTHYMIEASLQPDERLLTGTNRFVFVNHGTMPTNACLLFAYPNHLTDNDPYITDDIHPRIFPDGPNPGAMVITVIHADNRPCRVTPVAHPGFKAGVLVAVAFPSDIPPGAQTEISVAFNVTIPQRYGSFGAHDGGITLNGGWYPALPARHADGSWDLHAPPPSSTFEVRLYTDATGHVFLNNRQILTGDSGSAAHATLTADKVTLLFRPVLHTATHSLPSGNIRFLTTKPRPKTAARLFKALEPAVNQLRQRCPDVRPDEILLVETPLRRDLTIPANGIILVSDRFEQVFAYARDYHLAPVVEAVYAMLLSAARPPRDASGGVWETEALAWTEAKRFREQYSQQAESARTYLRPFGFIPEVDRWLNAPRFPFVGPLFGDFYERDPLREDFMRFNRITAHGRIIAEKLRDLLGEEAWTNAVSTALQTGAPLQPLAESAYGQPLEPFIAQWTDPYPRVNYELVSWQQTHEREHDRWLSEITLKRTGQPINEPVTVEIGRRMGPAYRGHWDGQGESGVAVIETPVKTRHLRIDPDRRLQETTRANNQYPAGFKVLLDSLRLRIDLNGRDHELRVGGALIIGNNYHNRYHFYGFTDQEQDGIELRHAHAFGHPFDAIDFSHEVMWGLLYSDLDENFVDASSTRENDSGRVAALKLGYELRTSQPGRNRLDGWTWTAEIESGDKVAGGDFRYWKAQTWMNGVIPLRRDRHLLALHGKLGTSDRQSTPVQLIYDIGGFDGVRGINRGRILGNHQWLARAEYRRMLWNDLEYHAFTVAWLRRLQLALYIDAGNVGDTTDELFDSRNTHWSAGAGIRLHIDALGAFPGIIRFDVARQLDHGNATGDRSPMFYIGIGQSF
jgi:hypothetical protein